VLQRSPPWAQEPTWKGNHVIKQALKLAGGVATVAGLMFALSAPALAHNRAHIILPDGSCLIVGSEKSVVLPDGTMLDLRPELDPWWVADQIGTSFAADEGNSRLLKGPCP
jgi:hypothetical protein